MKLIKLNEKLVGKIGSQGRRRLISFMGGSMINLSENVHKITRNHFPNY